MYETRTSPQSPIRIHLVTPPGERGWAALTLAPGKKTLGTDVRWERDLGACLRLELGLDRTATGAIAAIRAARSSRAVETLEQERFVEAYARLTGAGDR